MKTNSKEFVDLYHSVNEKYFTVDDPDSYQKAAQILNLILHRGDEWMIEAMATIGNELFKVVSQNMLAAHGSFFINGKFYFYDFYQNKDGLESVHKMLKNTVMVKAGEL